MVPAGWAAGRGRPMCPSADSISAPLLAAAVREAIRKRETDAIDGSASPRKPSVITCSRSSSDAILLVAWRASASGNSPDSMPAPSSRTRKLPIPPRSTSTVMCRAPASSAFSISSFATDAGRSMTSPAAIWSIRGSARIWIGMARPLGHASLAAPYQLPETGSLRIVPLVSCSRSRAASAARRVPGGGFSRK